MKGKYRLEARTLERRDVVPFTVIGSPLCML